MTRVGWWIRKEWREQRVIIMIALVAMVVYGWYWAWSGRGPVLRGETAVDGSFVTREVQAHRLRLEDWGQLFVTTVMMLPGFLLALSFAMERRRGALPMVARTGGAWGAAICGKLAFTFLVTSAAALLQGVWLGRLAVWYDLQHHDAPVHLAWLGPVAGNWTILTAWIYVAAVCTLGAIVAPISLTSLGGLALGAALVLPFAVLDDGVDHFYDWWLGSVRPLLLSGAFAAFCVGVLAWFRWVRSARNAWRAPLLAALSMLVLGGMTFAVAAVKRAEYDDVQPGDADARLHVEAIGRDERFAFVTATRTYEPADWIYGPTPRSRGNLFAIDLRTGQSRALGFGGIGDLQPPYGYAGSLDATLVKVWRRSDGSRFDMTEISPVTLERSSLAEAEQAEDEVVRARYSLPGERGQRTWLTHQGLRTQEPSLLTTTRPLDLVRPLSEATAIRPIPGGWVVRWGGQSGGFAPELAVSGPWASVQASDGLVRHLGIDAVQPRSFAVIGWLSPDRVLLTPRSKESDPREWRVLSLDARTSELAVGPLHETTPRSMRALAVFGSDSVLAWDKTSKPHALLVLDLRNGRTRRILEAEPALPHLHSAWAVEPHPTPTAVGGVLLVHVALGDLDEDANAVAPGVHVRSGSWVAAGPMPARQLEYRLVVVRVADGSAWIIGDGRVPLAVPSLLGIGGDGAVWVLEDARQIVRYGPEPGARQVLFPRAR